MATTKDEADELMDESCGSIAIGLDALLITSSRTWSRAKGFPCLPSLGEFSLEFYGLSYEPCILIKQALACGIILSFK